MTRATIGHNMPPEDPPVLACPKCRGGNIRIIEHFMTCDIIEVEGGVVKYRSVGEGETMNQFSGECDCGHRWTPRKKTGRHAVEKAQEL